MKQTLLFIYKKIEHDCFTNGRNKIKICSLISEKLKVHYGTVLRWLNTEAKMDGKYYQKVEDFYQEILETSLLKEKV